VFCKHFFHRGFFCVYSLTFEINLLLLLFFLCLVVKGVPTVIFLLFIAIFVLLIIAKSEVFPLRGYHFEIVLVDCIFLVLDQG
jgi:hypothetical protein